MRFLAPGVSPGKAWSSPHISSPGRAADSIPPPVPPLPGLLVTYGRYAATWVGQNEIIYVGEGVSASVAVSGLAEPSRRSQ